MIAGPTELFDMSGQVCVVTGASGGLGAVLADGLAAAGADVVITGRNAERLDAVAATLRARGVGVESVVADIRSLPDCCRIVEAARTRFNRLDVLVNNAGVTYAAATHKDRPGAFGELLDINLTGAYQMSAQFGRQLIDSRSGGSIVNITSILGIAPTALPTAAYSASKAGLIGLTKSLAAQWSGRHNIRVNALAPGYIATDMTAELLALDGALDRLKARTPMGRLARADELVGPLLLLASGAGSYITGITLPVDGGWTLH